MKYLLIIVSVLLIFSTDAQEIPSRSENLEAIVTFGRSAPAKWGDDDHVQIFFLLIPKAYTKPIHLSIYDPGVEGKNDLVVGEADTKTKFSVYGGKSNFSNKAARGINPTGNYKSGDLIASKSFGKDFRTDQKWVKLTALNPSEGEFIEEFDGYVFKIVCEGLTGNDGNHYKYFMSSSSENRVAIPGANGFTYEYSFQLKSDKNEVAHLYPYVDKKVDYIQQNNFDFDGDGVIKINSAARNGHIQTISHDGDWQRSRVYIKPAERNNSLDIQIEKKSDIENDMVFYCVNQYDEPIPFFASPLGQVKYKYDIEAIKE